MPDIKIVKTNNIEKVKRERNQLIFCKDGSIYFDYADDLRLRNVGEGAQLREFVPGGMYANGDMVSRDGKVYYFKGNISGDPDPIVVKEFKLCDWIYMCTTSAAESTAATDISYDPTRTQEWVEEENVQLAIEQIVNLLRNFNMPSHYNCVLGTFDRNNP